jgi:RNA polymerase-binding transcription factor DksA
MAATKKTTAKEPAKKSATPPKKTSSTGSAQRPASTTTAKSPAPSPSKAAAAAKAPAKAPAKSSATPTRAQAPSKAPAKKAPPAPVPEQADTIPAPRGTTKDGIAYTKDFDVKFLKVQHDALVAERAALTGQATRLEDEANSLIEEGEMGDVQFDDESGEGDTMVVERERDLALSAQARQTVTEIDAALERMAAGTYGYSIVSGAPIPRERLEAIPWATVLVEEKVGGIGRR